MDLKMRHARAGEAEYLSDLAVRSKGFWGYDEIALKRYRPNLSLTEEYINSGAVYVGSNEDTIVGFYGLAPEADLPRLYFLFLEPHYIGQRLGFRLWTHAIEMSKQRGWDSLTFYTDVFAANKFYLPLGCKKVGGIPSDLGEKLIELKYDFPKM